MRVQTILTDYDRHTYMEECSPNAFEPGDVVQMQVSFIAFQKSGKRDEKTFVIRTILRSIALMDSSVRIVSVILSDIKKLIIKR